MSKRTYLSESHRKCSEACQREVEEMSKHPLSHEELREQMKRNRKASLEASKFIFLDFDGVLNTEAWQRHCMSAGLPTEDGFGPVFDPEAVENLGAILTAVPDARIIITSSWKWEGLDKMKRLWTSRGLPGVLLDIAPDFVPKFDEEDFEKILQGTLPVGRGADIRAWQEQNGAEGNPYVILDDLPDFYPEQLSHHVETDPQVGITLEDAVRAIAILGGRA